ncbi:FeoB-associated Cys-rich membrane protein [Gemmata sp.]|uniref:FeoB-associated Cys-rich membrane protein n=1 Tax=Gemmata sp. TaxID=1914242 RepID=UPI003F6FF476
MSESTQLLIVAVAVAAAALYVARASFKTWFGKTAAACGSGCGKCATTTDPPPKGRIELPQV